MKDFSDADLLFFSQKFYKNIVQGFDEAITETIKWLKTDEATNFFYAQRERLTSFFEESGIRNKWDDIIKERANVGADLTIEIYNYARNVGRTADIVEYTNVERSILNRLADNQYELIKDVSEDQIKLIRKQLIQDYSEGVNPKQTSLKQVLDELKLEPVRGNSPEARAEMIARTETRRVINTATLENYKEQGVTKVQPDCSPGACAECESHKDDEYDIDKALDQPLFHPRCNCGWKPVKDETIGYYQAN